jgi:hypothetical protein
MPDTNLPVRRDLPVPLIPHPVPRQRPRIPVTWALGFALALGLALGLGLGLALTNRKTAIAVAPTLHVGPTIVAEPSVPTTLAIRIEPPELSSQQGWIKLAGLPPFASLSAGHVIGAGSWSVPLMRLAGLAITAPSGEGTRSRVTVVLMSSHGAVLAEAQFMFIVAAASRAAPTDAGSPVAGFTGPDASCPTLAVGRHSSLLSEQGSRWRAELLVQTGDKRLAEGNVTAAREFYRRAAEMGWSQAAFALGATYDPEAPRGQRLGVSPDPRQARCWYARARELAGMERTSQRSN